MMRWRESRRYIEFCSGIRGYSSRIWILVTLKSTHSPSIWLNVNYWVEYYCIGDICVTNYILCRLLEVSEYGSLREGGEVRSYTEDVPFFEVRANDGCLTFVSEIRWSSRVVEE